jgi:hypothetical protein
MAPPKPWKQVLAEHILTEDRTVDMIIFDLKGDVH